MITIRWAGHYLAHLAKLPTGLYILLVVNFFLFSFFIFLMIARRQIISGSTGPIFAIFAPNDRYLFVDDRSGPIVLIPQGTLPWQPIKIEKSVFFTDQSTWSRCHTEMDCNIAIPISKD